MAWTRPRIALLVLNFVLIVYPTNLSHGAMEHIVFGMKTEIAMAEKEVPRRDYYMSIGANQGVKVGTVLEVFRNVTTTDDINNRTAKNINFKIATLKVIHAEADISVGRIQAMLPAAEVPIGSFPTVVVGDEVAVAGK